MQYSLFLSLYLQNFNIGRVEPATFPSLHKLDNPNTKEDLILYHKI